MPRGFALRIALRWPLAPDGAGRKDGDNRCAPVLLDLPGYRRRGGTRAVNAEGERDEVGPVGQREGNEIVGRHTARGQPRAPLCRAAIEVAPGPTRRSVHDRETIGRKGCGEIGRASCRGRVCPDVSFSVVAVTLKKKKKK